MSSFDLSSLPRPLAEFFTAADHRETISLFAPDATVRDEGQTHQGLDQIAAWLERVETSYHPRYAVRNAEAKGDRDVVTFEVSGTFPGSPAVLQQAFTIKAGKIRRIETL